MSEKFPELKKEIQKVVKDMRREEKQIKMISLETKARTLANINN